MMEVTLTECTGGQITQAPIEANGLTYCVQALGSGVTWALINPPASVPVADRTGVFNDASDVNCGGTQ